MFFFEMPPEPVITQHIPREISTMNRAIQSNCEGQAPANSQEIAAMILANSRPEDIALAWNNAPPNLLYAAEAVYQTLDSRPYFSSVFYFGCPTVEPGLLTGLRELLWSEASENPDQLHFWFEGRQFGLGLIQVTKLPANYHPQHWNNRNQPQPEW